MTRLLRISLLLGGLFTMLSHDAMAFVQETTADVTFRFYSETADTLSVTYWPSYTYPVIITEGQRHTLYLTPHEPVIHTLNGVGATSRVLVSAKRARMVMQHQLVEVGDDVTVMIKNLSDRKSQLSFSGTGAAKYTLRHELQAMYWQEVFSSIKLLKLSEADRLETVIDSTMAEYAAHLGQYRTRLSEAAYATFEMDVLSYVKRTKLSHLAWLYSVASDDCRSSFQTLFERVLREPDPDTTGTSDYVDYLYFKEKLRLLYAHTPSFKQYEVTNPPYPWIALLEALATRYTGELRERLLTYALTNTGDIRFHFPTVPEEVFARTLRDSYAYVNDTDLRSLLAKLDAHLGPGVPAYEFSLPDEDGNIVSLSDFRGKVVFLEIWGHRCGGCLTFMKQFRETVYPVVKDMEGVAFISINVETDGAARQRAIEKHVSDIFVNLTVGALGMRHPILQHYAVHGFPFGILIDQEGRVIRTVSKSRELVGLIQEALD